MLIKDRLQQTYKDAIEFHDIMPGPHYIFRYPTISFKFYVEYFMGSTKFIEVKSEYEDVRLRACAVEDIVPKVGRFIKIMEEHDGPTHCPIIVAFQERGTGTYCHLGLFCFSDVGRIYETYYNRNQLPANSTSKRASLSSTGKFF